MFRLFFVVFIRKANFKAFENKLLLTQCDSKEFNGLNLMLNDHIVGENVKFKIMIENKSELLVKTN